jgi:hypothetical protein
MLRIAYLHVYLKFRSNCYKVRSLLTRNITQLAKFGVALKHDVSTLVPKKQTKTRMYLRHTFLWGHDGSRWSDPCSKIWYTSCSAFSFSGCMHTDSPLSLFECMYVCARASGWVSVISMDHGTSCYEVFLPLPLCCSFLQDVSSNTANSTSLLSPPFVQTLVLSQIIPSCHDPGLNTKAGFVAVSNELTCNRNYFIYYLFKLGYALTHLGEAFRYTPEGCGCDSQCDLWDFLLI